MFKKINKVVVLLTVSDVFTWGLFLIITALVGLYLQDRFESNIEQVIGIGIALNYMTKTLTEIPIGKISDKIKNDKDDSIVPCILQALFVFLSIFGKYFSPVY